MHNILRVKPLKTMRSLHLRVKPARTALGLRHLAQTKEEFSSQSLYQLALLQRRRNYHLHYLEILKKRETVIEQELDSLNQQIKKIAKETKTVVREMADAKKTEKKQQTEREAKKIVVEY